MSVKPKYYKCGFITNEGNGCRRMVREDGEKCYQHCERAVRKYKKVCGDVWNGRCSHAKTKDENIATRAKAIECAKRRIKFSNDCVDVGCDDQGHHFAIQKMIGLDYDCDKIIRAQNQRTPRTRGRGRGRGRGY